MTQALLDHVSEAPYVLLYRLGESILMWSVPARLRSMFRGVRRNDRLDQDMEAEFRLHMELRADDLVRGGLTPAEAVRRARLEFGSTESFKDHGREARGLRWFDSLRFSILDVKLGARMIVKHPGLTVIGTFAVAFAIAIGTAAFEIGTQVLFPRIPLPNGDAVVVLRNWNTQSNGPVSASPRDYARWKSRVTTMADVGAILVRERNVAWDGFAGEPVMVADVSASMFATTGVPALQGRTLLPADEHPDAEPVIVIGYEFWQNKLGGVADVVGHVIRISGTSTRIVGVMPRGYAFPRKHGLWRPLHLENFAEATPVLTYAVGHLEPGRTLDEANAELATISAAMATMFPETHKSLRAQVVSLPQAVWPIPAETSMVLGSVNFSLVMLIALVCGNVALLLFARAASRQTEIVVRTALGASRGRIITQLFVEALVLCMLGAVVGLVASNLVLRWVWTIAEGQEGKLPFWMGTSLSPTTVVYAIGLTLFAAAIAGVVPALKVTSGGVDARLRAMSSGGGGLQFSGVWTGIIVVQIALTATFPFVTSFMRDDYLRQRHMPAGFAAEQFLTAILALDLADGAAASADTLPEARAARLEARYRALADRLESEPGVLGVTYANRLPLMYHPPVRIEMDSGPVTPRGPDLPPGYAISNASVDPRFFDVIGAPVIRGRSLSSADAEPGTHTVVVNELFVTRVMAGHNPIGRRFRFIVPEGSRSPLRAQPRPWFEIVGVVPNLGIDGDHPFPGESRIYAPTLPRRTGPLYVAIHVRGDPQRFTSRLRELALATDPALRIVDPQPLPHVMHNEVELLAFIYYAIAGVAVVALVLSLASVYSVTAFAVAKRTREIGVRVALGATPWQIVFVTFKRASIQVALGIGIAALIMGTFIVADWEKPSWDAVGRVGIVVLLIALSCMAACIVPVRRALGIQPTEALKDDG
jgi:putative ABC transport system permease protein